MHRALWVMAIPSETSSTHRLALFAKAKALTVTLDQLRPATGEQLIQDAVVIAVHAIPAIQPACLLFGSSLSHGSALLCAGTVRIAR